MSRLTTYNYICDNVSTKQFDTQNQFLLSSFEEYLESVDKAKSTIDQYMHDLKIFFTWNLNDNNNKPFTKISKREFAKFQGNAINIWKWSSNRIRRVKSTISSLSNYIENILDEEEEFKDYHSIIRKIESPVCEPVRDKSVFEEMELQQLLNILVKNKHYKAACMLSLAMNSARRKAELPRFKVSYFTDENTLYGSLYKTPEKIVTKGRGSKGKLLNLYVLKKSFDPYLKLWLEERKEKGIESEWLFPKTNNPEEHITDDTMDEWKKQFNKILKKENISDKEFYWHSMRHYMTTELVRNNIPANVIKGLIGWDSIEMVDIYNDLSTDDILGNYFDENGIKDTKVGTISSL